MSTLINPEVSLQIIQNSYFRIYGVSSLIVFLVSFIFLLFSSKRPNNKRVTFSGRGCDVTLSDVKASVAWVEMCSDVVVVAGVALTVVVVTAQCFRHFESLLMTFSKEFLKTKVSFFQLFVFCVLLLY